MLAHLQYLCMQCLTAQVLFSQCHPVVSAVGEGGEGEGEKVTFAS